MTGLDWLLFGLIGYAAVVTLVLLLVRGGALGEAEEERARARYLYERGQR